MKKLDMFGDKKDSYDKTLEDFVDNLIKKYGSAELAVKSVFWSNSQRTIEEAAAVVMCDETGHALVEKLMVARDIVSEAKSLGVEYDRVTTETVCPRCKERYMLRVSKDLIARNFRIQGTFVARAIMSREREMQSAYVLDSDCRLIYQGIQKEGNSLSLVDCDSIKDISIDDLECFRPGFVLFKNNKYLHNAEKTKLAGQPDLVVEPWSDYDFRHIREMKFNLYSSSPVTEHWYIERDSNTVECWYGNHRISDQNLTNVLRTCGGLKFDLREFAL